MSSAPLPPIPRGNLLQWAVKNPHHVAAFLERIVAQENLEVVMKDSSGATSRNAVQFGKRNATIEVQMPTPVVRETTQQEVTAGGDVFGPASSEVDRVATFADASGKRIRDSGININDLVGGRIASYGYTDVFKSGSQGVANGSGDTPIALTNAVSNDFGLWSPTMPTRFTFPTSGIWLLVARLDYSPNATGARFCYIRINGGSLIAINALQAVNVSPGGIATIISTFAFKSFLIGDYVEICGQQWSGSTLNATYAQLTAVRIDVSNVPSSGGGGGGSGADLASIVCSSGNVVTSSGEVVWNLPPS